MSRRVVILTEIISPYRIPLFNALAQRPDIDLHVIFLSETDPSLRQWAVYKSEIKFSYQTLPSWRKRIGKYNALLNCGIGSALNGATPQAIVCGGYNYVASWQALRWARSRGVPFLLWSESNLQDARQGHAWVESLKRRFVNRCQAFVVPGRSALEYVRSFRIAEDRIFTAPNAVDNDFFHTGAESARSNEVALRQKLGLPVRYFLFVGRLVREKGVFELISAYAKLDERLRDKVGLVFVGDGISRRRLEDQAAAISPGMIRFAGFAQREQLAIYYALADMLILPTYSDPWGLVVNEAMACGLPIVVTDVAGCAADLVQHECNGIRIPPMDVFSLANAMQYLANHPDLRGAMSANSRRQIVRYSPIEWASGMVRALEGVGGSGD